MLDSTVVTLALPAIEQDLGASPTELEWVAASYLLALGSLVVPAGRLGDIRGPRPVFVGGLVLFGAGACLSALADTPEVLIAGRLLQGVGGASVIALSLAIVNASFRAPERPRAIGIWTGVSAAALALGPFVGGALVDAAGWRSIFWWMIPFVVIGIVLIERTGPQAARDRAARLDLPGTISSTVGLSLILLFLIEGREWGWTSAPALLVGLCGLAALVAFVVIERRVSQPIVDFIVFRNRAYFGASAAAFCLVACWWAVIFYQPQYLQNVLGHPAIVAGLLILPITAPMALLSPVTGPLIVRFGARAVMTIGMSCGVAGLLCLTAVSSQSDYLTLLPGYLLFGIALSLVYAPMSGAAMAAMPDEKAGVAAGVLAMNRVLAGALSLGVIGALYQHLLAAGAAAGESTPVAASAALSTAAWVLAAICAVGALLTWMFVADSRRGPES